MDTLPPEILAQIVDSVAEVHDWTKSYRWGKCGAQFAQYSSISRAWKTAIEQITFKEFTITTDEMDAFAALFSGNKISRMANLTLLSVVFILPSPPNALGCCPVVRILDREADSAAFSASVVKLFTILADLAARAAGQPSIFLSFYKARRPSKYQGPKFTAWMPCQPPGGEPQNHSRREILEAKAVSGQFQLMYEDCVPNVRGIKTFECLGFDDLEDLKPTWIPGLVGRLLGLEVLLLRAEDLYDAGRRERIAQRECFAASIRNLAGDHLCEIRLEINHDPMQNENLPVHKLVDDGQWHQETWFQMLNHLASFPSLAILHLLGGLVICPEFFRDIADHPGTPFRSLIEFELQFATETADGRWFYESDDEALEKARNDPEFEYLWESEDEDPEDDERGSTGSLHSEGHVRVFEDGPFRTEVVFHNRYRSVPNTATFLPFLMDASKAVSRIPSLRKFILKLGNKFAKHDDLRYFPVVSRVFELWYLRVGMHRSPRNGPIIAIPDVPGDATYLNQNRLYWRVDGWKPWSEVRAAWSAIAGLEAKIVFLDEDKWTYTGGNTMLHLYEGVF